MSYIVVFSYGNPRSLLPDSLQNENKNERYRVSDLDCTEIGFVGSRLHSRVVKRGLKYYVSKTFTDAFCANYVICKLYIFQFN